MSDALIRQIVDQSPAISLVVAGPDFRIIYGNPAAHRAAGAEPGDLVGQVAAEAFAFVDPVLLATPLPAPVCAVPDRRSGGTTWWDVTYLALDPEASDPPTVLITAVDVTHHERRRVEAQAAQDKLDALLSCIPDGVAIACGPELVVERFSSRGAALARGDGETMTGLSALRHTGGWDVYLPGDDAPLAPSDRPLARAAASGEVRSNQTLVVRRPDGSLLTVLCSSAPIRDRAGAVTGAVMTWRDAGELQRAQAAIRDSEELLRAVLLQVPAAMFIVEAPDGQVTFRSRMLDEVLGSRDSDVERARATLSGWALHEDSSPYAIEEFPSRRALWRGETVRAEPMVYRRADGRLIDLEMYAAPVQGESGEIIAAVAVAMDVTERRRAEATQALLFGLQDRLRELTDPRDILTAAAGMLGRHLGAARVGFGEMQPDGETMLLASGYVDGAPPLNGLFPFSMIAPLDQAQMREGRTLVYEDTLADESGARRLGLELGARAYVSAPLIRNGRLTGALYVTHFEPHTWGPADIALIEEVAARIWDAAERGRAETRLRQSEERLRLVVEASGFGAWEYDAIDRRAIRSPRHDEIFGYPEPVGDWSYEQFESHVHRDDRERVADGFRAALDQGSDCDVEFRLIRADGSEGWARVLARSHRGADGRVVRLLGVVEDITDRRRAADALTDTAAKFEMLAQSLPSMVWTSLPDGQIDWFNARVPEYCGTPSAEMMPDGWSPVHPEDREASVDRWRKALACGEPYVDEYRIRRHDGMYRWHITRAVPIRAADGSITRWIGSSADIQDQKSSEQALAHLNATLERQVRERTAELVAAEETLRQSQKMEAVGQLTGGLAHDFNNLLTGIAGSLELMAARLEQGRFTELGRYLKMAQGATQRAAALTHRLLAFSRRQTLDPKPTDVNALVSGMDELIRRTVGPSVELKVVAAPHLWPVLADPNQLENALLNLCLNARDAMPDGGELIIETGNHRLERTEAAALQLPAAEYVCLSVTDSGVGMTPEVIARAFDPFYTTKPLGEGTGLGLSMVYGFARQSGGQARILSEPGRGAQICLYLPRCEIEGAPPFEEEIASGTQRGDGQTVLVVDDEASVRLLVREVLDELGYEVLEAETGAGGLEVLQSPRRIDLLVSDVGLPGDMNGRQLADAALARRPDLKVLFITGYAETAVIGDGQLKPPMYILTKPFTLEMLGARVKQIIMGG